MKQFRNSGQFKMLDLTGVRSGIITALFPSKHQHGIYYWRCKCDCGNETDVTSTRIKRGITKSCGCLRLTNEQNKTHGLKNHKLYNVWANMKQRCYNENCESYINYGGRGISVCHPWLISVVNFFNDMNPTYSVGLHLDRIDVNGNYDPSNCRWVTGRENNNNKRNNIYVCLDGKTHTLSKLSVEVNVKADTMASRKRKGWSDKECVFGRPKKQA